MHYGEIKDCDIANGAGVRITLFVSGCRNKCPNCFQPETWDFEYGQKYTQETTDKLLKMLDKSYIDGLTILGGEPMDPANQQGVLYVIEQVREALPYKNIWIYSGYTYEELMDENSECHTNMTEEILGNIDVLVDGRYVDELRDISLKFRGSKNQRIIDVPATVNKGKVVLAME